jgi:hypothetical protein
MDRTVEKISTQALAEITHREVSLYAATSDTATFYPVLDDEHQTYAVVVVEHDRSQSPIWVFVLARIVRDNVIIEEDTTLDKHLVDALIHNGGIPRDQIVLAYKGESVPDPAR